MQTTILITLLYALVLLAGGLFGYWKAGSSASLISSSIFTIVLIVSAIGMSKDKEWGLYGALASILLLIGVFGTRFYTTGSWIPAGIMLIMSVLMLVFLLVKKP